MSTSHSQSKTKIIESMIEGCHSEPTVTTASNIYGQELSVYGDQFETKQAHTSHLITAMNPASFHGLEVDECINQEKILTGSCDKTHTGRVQKIVNSLQKLLILLKGMAYIQHQPSYIVNEEEKQLNG